jgi:hypothetical protein
MAERGISSRGAARASTLNGLKLLMNSLSARPILKTVSHEFGVSCSAPLSTPKALTNAAIWSLFSFDSARSSSGLSAALNRLKKIISPFSARALVKASLCAMV